MIKREIIKKIRKKYKVNTKRFDIYDFEIIGESNTYHVKVLNITNSHQITINSKIIWELKKGKLNGIRFKTLSSELLSINKFNNYKNKIILLTEKPYKILKVLNESGLKDISEKEIIDDIFVTSDIDELIRYIK